MCHFLSVPTLLIAYGQHDWVAHHQEIQGHQGPSSSSLKIISLLQSQVRAFTSICVKIVIYFNTRTYFFYFIPLLFQDTHVILCILYCILLKYYYILMSFFSTFSHILSSPPPNNISHHQTTSANESNQSNQINDAHLIITPSHIQFFTISNIKPNLFS